MTAVPPNPFIIFYEHPVAVLATIAYVCLLLAATTSLAGIAWSTALHIRNAVDLRHTPHEFGPEWEYVPPLSVWLRVAALLLIVAIEAFLVATLLYIVGIS